MAYFEQKINGKIVKSNLELDRTEGSFVYFTDGSWCNADTGQVSLVGDGYINISGDPTAPAAKRETVEMKFDPRPLKVTGLYAGLEVVPHSDNNIVVTIEGTEAEIKGIEAKESGAYIVVTGGQPSGVNIGGTISVTKTKSHSGNIIADILGGNFSSFSQTIIGSIGNVGPKVTIKVPVATDISAAEIHGDVIIGNILGNVSISMETSNDVTIGDTKNCKVTIDGSGAFQIGNVEGNFDITVNGSGDTDVNKVNGTIVALINGRGGIEIASGEATIFDIKNKASGDFVYNGKAHNAKLVLEGMGGIEISETIGDLIIESEGSGDIEISKVRGGKIGAKLNGRGGISIEDGNATLVHVVSNGSGEFEFDGSALDTSLTLTGRGGIDITKINGDLDITTSGSGDIDIDSGTVGKLKVVLSGRGGVSFDGHAVDADLKSTGSGDIDVTHVENKPSISQRGRGDITVDNWDD